MIQGMRAGVVDVCLIPEIDFQEDKLMACIEKILGRKGHAVVCVAEGAGQTLLASSHSHSTDASGNPILADIGIFLRDRIKKLIKVCFLPGIRTSTTKSMYPCAIPVNHTYKDNTRIVQPMTLYFLCVSGYKTC